MKSALKILKTILLVVLLVTAIVFLPRELFPQSLEVKHIEDSGGSELDSDPKNSPLAATTNEGSPGDDIGIPSEYFMTFDEICSIQNINLNDKLAGLSIINKINKADAARIYDLAHDGLTIDEMNEIKQMLKKSLSADEIEKLSDILQKCKEQYAADKIANR